MGRNRLRWLFWKFYRTHIKKIRDWTRFNKAVETVKLSVVWLRFYYISGEFLQNLIFWKFPDEVACILLKFLKVSCKRKRFIMYFLRCFVNIVLKTYIHAKWTLRFMIFAIPKKKSYKNLWSRVKNHHKIN